METVCQQPAIGAFGEREMPVPARLLLLARGAKRGPLAISAAKAAEVAKLLSNGH
jgi:hypothetical protein